MANAVVVGGWGGSIRNIWVWGGQGGFCLQGVHCLTPHPDSLWVLQMWWGRGLGFGGVGWVQQAFEV